MEHFDYFPTRVYRAERPDLLQPALSVCNRYLDEVRNNNFLVSQTHNLGREIEIRSLSDYLLLSAGNILREQGYMVEKYDFYVSSIWAQEIKPGGSTDIDLHKNSQICGLFFLEVPKSGISVVYHDTRLNKTMIELDFEQNENITYATNSIYFQNLNSGTVLFNNSWMAYQLLSVDPDSHATCIHFTISHRELLCNMY
jgi:hypothetical protein